MLKQIIRGIQQRIFYIKNSSKYFSFVFLLPGSIREKIDENLFFKTLIKKNKDITIGKDPDENTIIKAGKFLFKFPPKCFYEGDFFDIIYPYINKEDPIIDTFVYNNPFYESEGCYEKFGAILEKGDFVIDAGANVGTFSIVSSTRVGESGKIFSFEPLDEVISVLEENITNNNCKNIVIEKNILGEKNKEIDFFYNLNYNYNASSVKIKKDGDKVIKLKQITLDEYVLGNKIEKIDFLKADIEGSERDLLKGSENTIKKYKPKISIRTYHLPDDKEVLYKIIKGFVPEYNIVLDKKNLYAWI
jgi:FkbM family methyltransferase